MLLWGEYPRSRTRSSYSESRVASRSRRKVSEVSFPSKWRLKWLLSRCEKSDSALDSRSARARYWLMVASGRRARGLFPGAKGGGGGVGGVLLGKNTQQYS